MKKMLIFLLQVLLVFSLCACSKSNEPYTVEKDWRTFEIDPEANTISDETDTYKYTISGDSSDYRISITYPDGSTYYESYKKHNSGTSISGGFSDDYDKYRYVSGDILCEALADEVPYSFASRNPIVGILLIGLGLFQFAAPRAAWYLEWGWRFKDAEPSNAALVFNQVFGAIFIVAGILAFFLL